MLPRAKKRATPVFVEAQRGTLLNQEKARWARGPLLKVHAHLLIISPLDKNKETYSPVVIDSLQNQRKQHIYVANGSGGCVLLLRVLLLGFVGGYVDMEPEPGPSLRRRFLRKGYKVLGIHIQI